MLKVLAAVNNLFGTLLALVILAVLGGGGWLAFRTYFAEKWAAQEAQEKLVQREAEIGQLKNDLQTNRHKLDRVTADLSAAQEETRRLNEELVKKAAQIKRLETAMRLLKVDHRIAHVAVLRQQGSPKTGDLTTQFSFVEVDEQGKPIDQARVFTVAGDVIYLDAWVVKFTDEHVESGDDPLRATSVCLFRRVFGEAQQPKEGFVLDAVGSRPAAYADGAQVSEMEQEIWERFWELANDPAKAKKAGVRAAHGEAPSIKLMPGRRYTVSLRASGGLSITAEDAPKQPL